MRALSLCTFIVIVFGINAQTLLYEANFDADSGSGINLSGASPDGWTAEIISTNGQFGSITVGPDFVFESGLIPGIFPRTIIWTSDTIALGGFTTLDFSASMGITGPIDRWQVQVNIGDLDSIIVSNPIGIVSFQHTLDAIQPATVITIVASTTLKNKQFSLDDVALSGSCGGTDIPEGECDCDGTQIDALGVCGGDCEADFNGDGACDWPSPCDGPLGCTYPEACNFMPEATNDDGSCSFPLTGLDCNGLCIVDTDGDGICDENELAGCTSFDALNFYPLATEDDGTCVFAPSPSCAGDFDNDGVIGVSDILELLSSFGLICD